MGKGNATVTATSSASNVAQTVTLSKGTGVSSINIAGTNYSSSSVSLNCGSYSISGNYASYYAFSSWSRSGSVTVSSTSSASTTMTVSGAGTLTLNAKDTRIYMWNATMSQCGQTMYDNRDGTTRAYTTAKIGSLCWMTRNLMLGKSSTTRLTNSNTNLNGSLTYYDLPASSTSGFTNTDGHYIYNSGSTTCSSTSPCYGYYSHYAATAGTSTTSYGDAPSDICPKGWRLPTADEFQTLANTYTTGSAIQASPFYAVKAGLYNGNGTIPGSGTFHYNDYGHLTSSTSLDASRIYLFAFSDSVGPRVSYNNAWKYIGYPMRCVKAS